MGVVSGTFDLRTYHIHVLGGHLGRDKTIKKICSRFFWKNMCDDIKEYIRQCDRCQRMNCKLQKSNAELHPVPIHPVVWNQIQWSGWRD